MVGDVRDEDAATEVATAYADEECVGTVGDVTAVRQTDSAWVVEFETHTYAETYEHRVKINSAGNVFAHERDDRLD